ncbi:MAG: hypothetical protein R6X02_18990 [Enhygromyxa sp.]
MFASTALITALSLVLGYLPGLADRTSTPSSVATSDYELLDRGSYTDKEGRRITYAVWLENGELQADVSITDRASRDYLELWVEGERFVFEGVFRGEPFRGAEPASTFFDTNPDAPTCAGWVALVCLGALAVLASGCSMFSGCTPVPPPKPPGGGGGVPDDGGEGDGDGGGGDGED